MDGATLTAVTVAGTDKVLLQDVSDASNIKTVTAQAIADLSTSGIANVVEDLTPQLGGNLDLNGNVITGLVIGTDVQAHSAVLDATTASFLTADETKLDGIEAGAEVNTVTASSTTTFTNKTFDANGTGNSLSNVDVADLANGTDGELITWDATGAPATVAVGTATHVLTSNGIGVAPTFQAAGGGGGGAWIPILTQTASASSNINFTSGIDGTYSTYAIVISSAIGSVDGTTFRLLLSTDGGSTHESTNYSWHGQQLDAAGAGYDASVQASTSSVTIGGSVGNASTESGVGSILYFDNPSSTTRHKKITGVHNHQRDDSTFQTGSIGSLLQNTSAVDAFRFEYSSGTITSGEFTLYGLATS